MIRSWYLRSLRRFVERHACPQTGLDLDVVTASDGSDPCLRIRTMCRCYNLLLGEVFFRPDRADAFVARVSELSANVRSWETPS